MRRTRLFWLMQIVLAAIVFTGCSRVDRFAGGLRSVRDPEAQEVLRECIWAHGSFYRWTQHSSLQCKVTISRHERDAEETEEQVWLLDLERGRWRIERADGNVVEVFDGATVRVFKDGLLQEDVSAVGDARMACEILTLPFSLIEPPGCQIIYAGQEVNPGGGQAWHRLAVAYAPSARRGGRMLVYIRSETDGVIRRRTDMIDRLFVSWAEPPFNGVPMLVELGLYRRVGGIAFATQWDFYRAELAEEPGRYMRKGRPCWQIQVTDITIDVPLKDEMFRKP